MYKFLLHALLLLPMSLFAQPHNLQIASSLADSLAQSFPNFTDTVLISTTQTDPQLLILQAIARKRPIKIVSQNENYDHFLYLAPAILTVDYSPIDKNQIKRTISISLSFQNVVRNVYSKPVTIELFSSDTLLRSQAEQINASSPEFLRKQLPDPEDSLWEQLLRPTIVVATLAATVWLFFSVRSR